MKLLKAFLVSTLSLWVSLACITWIKYLITNPDADHLVATTIQIGALFWLSVCGYAALVHTVLEYLAERTKNGTDDHS